MVCVFKHIPVRAFNIREPIYPELCREFYATYEFDEFARKLGLYHAEELEEDGLIFIFRENGYANVAWVIAKWMKRKGARSQKDSQICYGQFISKIAKKSKVLTDEIVCTLSTPIYCRDLDRTTLRELINSEDRLIPDIPNDDVQRVAAQRASRVQRASMQDLYERMGSIEIK
ncbi:hypothetical protein Tco_0449390 [Tanacetum coccineum]